MDDEDDICPHIRQEISSYFFKKIILNLFLIFSGLNIGDSSGAFNPAVTSNFALQNGQANAQFGGGANIGSLDLGNGGTDFENLLDFSQIGNLLQGR